MPCRCFFLRLVFCFCFFFPMASHVICIHFFPDLEVSSHNIWKNLKISLGNACVLIATGSVLEGKRVKFTFYPIRAEWIQLRYRQSVTTFTPERLPDFLNTSCIKVDSLSVYSYVHVFFSPK